MEDINFDPEFIGSICVYAGTCMYRYIEYVYVHVCIPIYKYLCAPHIFLEFWLAIIIFLNLVTIFGSLYKPLLAFIFINWIYFPELCFQVLNVQFRTLIIISTSATTSFHTIVCPLFSFLKHYSPSSIIFFMTYFLYLLPHRREWEGLYRVHRWPEQILFIVTNIGLPEQSFNDSSCGCWNNNQSAKLEIRKLEK